MPNKPDISFKPDSLFDYCMSSEKGIAMAVDLAERWADGYGIL
jgi:hypothetical protein